MNPSTRSGRYRSKSKGLGRDALSGSGDRDLSISSYSSDRQVNKSGTNANNLDKLFGKNYFLDGEQLMRHMSPSTPNRESLENDDQFISLVSNNRNS